MTEHDPDPLDALRAANPVDADRLSSASLARVRARVSEDVMSTSVNTRRPWQTRILGFGGAAAVAAIALFIVLRGPAGGPGVGPGGSFGTGSASCVEAYTPTALTHRSFAFDGTVSAISGESVTFTIGKAFKGAAAQTVTLDAPGMTGSAITSIGGPKLAVDQRYLVAGDDHFAWACGYTQPYDAAIAAQWAAALGS
ncbi:MAG TPA: hypothetical protein VGQ85_04450 [Candidatus Limnocylindrales bacterium]|nr:hypothetical protein [Candidatus Limnocylindrales bacterium]